MVGFSTFGSALYLVPANSDDLILLSSVANTSSPAKYFIGDWGRGEIRYRPLHSLTLWLAYKIFGVSAGFNQLFNLILHFVIICLLFRLIRSVKSDITLNFLIVSLSLVSLYTLSPATWVSDRPTLFVALFFLLLLNHLYKNGHPNQGRISYIYVLSILALLSKESGLIVPLFVFYYSFHMKQYAKYRTKVIIHSIVIIAVYFTFRFAIFGSQVSSNIESGYIFGIIRYNNLSTLPVHIQYYAHLENVIKNLITPFVPIFNGRGGILMSVSSLFEKSLLSVLTMLLVVLTAHKKLSTFQKVALVIIIINSVLHYPIFRYRTHYISQLAICMFIASSPLLKNSINRKIIVKVIAVVLLLFSILGVNRSLNSSILSRYEMLNKYNLTPIVQRYSASIDNRIVERVLQRYKQ